MTKRYGKSQDELQRCFIREWRKHRGLTQEQLADAIDSTKQTVSRMEGGNLPYNQPFLEACADALDCSPADLISAPPSDSDLLEQLIAKLRTKNDVELQRISQMIDLMNRG